MRACTKKRSIFLCLIFWFFCIKAKEQKEPYGNWKKKTQSEEKEITSGQ